MQTRHKVSFRIANAVAGIFRHFFCQWRHWDAEDELLQENYTLSALQLRDHTLQHDNPLNEWRNDLFGICGLLLRTV